MATKPSKAPAVKPAPAAPKVNKHAGHVQIDQVGWNEAKAEHYAYRLCSCGAKRRMEG